MNRSALLWCCLLLLSFTVDAQKSRLSAAPLPDWITDTAVNTDAGELAAEAEDGVLDLDYEQQVNLATATTYLRKVVRILSETGVEENSEVSIGFDPTYQQVLLHRILIRRGSVVINKLNVDRFKLIQQEKDLHRHLYDGSLTAMLILDDVRKGDIIEYCYSLQGSNPVLGGKFAGFFSLQFSVPVVRLFYKVVVPQGRSIQVGEGAERTTMPTPHGTEYIFQRHHLAPLKISEELPSWYEAYPVVMVSEYKTWKEVVDWALPLYQLPGTAIPQVRQLAGQIQKTYASAEDRTVAALRFVQDEIRYMGIEMGAGSHKPNSPEQVLQQRYGDCKDKALLLVTLLRQMNIEAYPVLVHSTDKQNLFSRLPAPAAFDHVVAQVRINGAVYHFDPTNNYQRGGIDQISFPDYGGGLLVKAGVTALHHIALQDKAQTEITETFDIKSMNGPAMLTVVTRYQGSAADYMRSRFKEESVGSIKKSYQEFYAAYFKKTTAKDLSFDDDSAAGVFATTERYEIDDVWGESRSLKKGAFEAFVISSLLKRPGDDPRKYPLGLGFPAKYTERVVINLPEDWKTDRDAFDISNPAFTYSARYTCTGNRAELLYTYEALKNHVAPEDLDDYRTAVAQVDKNIGYTLSYSITDDTVSGSASGLLSANYFYLYLILGLCVLVTYQWKKASRNR